MDKNNVELEKYMLENNIKYKWVSSSGVNIIDLADLSQDQYEEICKLNDKWKIKK